ncbi:MAG: type II toxin-antitoxin system RelB/DinJ family antitoxin [Bdellovibrionales bacterium]|nr:type II toxin-antitoxin system RelB/DinJ family antitoxin [Bdellovibrionales bacterium]
MPQKRRPSKTGRKSKTGNLSIRIDEELKDRAEEILSKSGLSLSEGVRSFFVFICGRGNAEFLVPRIAIETNLDIVEIPIQSEAKPTSDRHFQNPRSHLNLK